MILSFVFVIYSIAVYAFCDQSPEVSRQSPEVLAGWESWQQHNCQSCHQLYGLGGYLGPDLTNTASVKGMDYMRGFIRYGTGRMPDFHLKAHEVDNILAFLSWVDKSGRSRVPDSSVHWTGSYKITRR